MSNAIVGMGSIATAAVQTMTGPSATAPTREKMTRLYNKIDTSGAGSISQSQFQAAFQSMAKPAGFQALGAHNTFALLDPSGSGSVSKSDFINGMSSLSATLRSATTKAG